MLKGTKKMNKHGVALVTVLLFMLVATIAATATFKWLTSENLSSASRLRMNEARLSATAGITSARLWLASHANETGAILYQYMNNGKVPIQLTSALKANMREGQNFDVYLVGVDVHKQPYEVKIVSVGTGYNDTKYSEAAILKISGLYQAAIPQQRAVASSLDKAFHGASQSGVTGNDALESAQISGNFTSSNTPRIANDLVVSGQADFRGNTTVGGNLYVRGDFFNDGATNIGTVNGDNVAYIGGSVTKCSGAALNIQGDLYVGGDIAQNCDVNVSGNLTINGNLDRSENHYVKVGGNLVFTDKASWDVRGDVLSMSVSENTYMPKKMTRTDEQNGNRKAELSGKIYLYNGVNYNHCQSKMVPDYAHGFFNNCPIGPAEQNSVNGYYFLYKSTLPDNKVQAGKIGKWERTDGVLKNVGHDYWSNIDKMADLGKVVNDDGTISQPVLLKNADEWTQHTANEFCNLPTNFDMDDSHVRSLNDCYIAAVAADQLRNGFLVIEWKNTYTQSSSVKLKGKFVFYVSSRLNQTALPSTADGSMVMLYLKEGSGLIKGIDGSTSPNNYFIFSEGDIQEVQSFNLKGSIVMADGASMGIIQGGNDWKFDQNIVDALTDAGFIEANPAFEEKKGNNAGGVGAAGANLFDDRYIAASSQLYVSLVSEYRNNEFVPTEGNYESIEPSLLIMPRVIYIPTEAPGKLDDYYQIVKLNGAQLNEDGYIGCQPGGLNYPERFQSYGIPNVAGYYTCTYSDNTYGNQDFYVVVKASADNPAVNFTETSREIVAGTAVDVVLKVNPGTEPMKINIYKTLNPDANWTVETLHANRLQNVNGTEHFEVNVQPRDNDTTFITLFRVNITEDATEGRGITFQLSEPCENCIIGNRNAITITTGGFFEVERKEVSDFCDLPGQSSNPKCKTGGEYNKKMKAPSCEDKADSLGAGAWVEADGVGCRDDIQNSKWKCNVLINPDVHLESKLNVDLRKLCEVVIPDEDDNRILNTSEDASKKFLYASLVRKINNLYVNIKNASSSGSEVRVTLVKPDGNEDVGECDKSDKRCLYETYSGYRYLFEVFRGSGDKFSRWECQGVDCPASGVLSTAGLDSFSVVATADMELTAMFNDVDKHCFYEDFGPDENNDVFNASCNSSNGPRCVDICRSTLAQGNSCNVHESAYWISETSNKNPAWVMVYNSSTDLSPVISNNYITANSNIAGVGNGSRGVILSSKENGANGILTSIFSTDVLTAGESFNSGYVFRANENASEYYSISFYGKSDNGSDSPNIYANLCYVGSQNGASKCEEKTLTMEMLAGIGASLKPITKVTMILTIQNENITINFVVDNSVVSGLTREIRFNLKNIFGEFYVHNDVTHNHVGMLLSSNKFSVYDISWSSSDYGAENCFDVPKLVCSFKSNYLGGIVPMNENVSPWVSFSSYSNSTKYSGCSVDYYYNGCDNQVSYKKVSKPEPAGPEIENIFSCKTPEDIGFFWDKGSLLNDDTYYFLSEGRHGAIYNNSAYSVSGIARDAKVQMKCPTEVELASSLYLPQTCGEFNVGSIVQCSENADFLNGSSYSETCSGSCSFDFSSSDGANIRGSTIVMNVSNINRSNVRMTLVDVDGNVSAYKDFSGTGTITIGVDALSDIDDFNPQAVKTLKLEVDNGGSIEILSAKAVCPNALGIESCKVTYDGTAWNIDAKINNAVVCDVELPMESNADKSEVGNCSGKYRLSEPGLYGKDSDIDYVFTVVAKDGVGYNAKTESIVCNAVQVKPISIYCEVDESIGKGLGTPTLMYSFANCPKDGCPYTITLDGSSVTGLAKAGVDYTQTFADMNKPGTPFDLNSEHYYTISSMGKENTSCGFKVVEGSSVAKASACSFDASGSSNQFSANVAITRGNTWSGEIAVYDALGHQVGKSLVLTDLRAGALSRNINVSLTSGQKYVIKLSVNGGLPGNEGCEVEYEKKSGLCNCEKYCGDLCNSLGSRGINGSNGSTKCVFTTAINGVNENYSKNPIYVNDVRIGYCDGASSCAQAIANNHVQKVDGGYYIKIPQTTNCWNNERREGCDWLSVDIKEGDSPTCGSGDTPTPTASNCAVGETELKSGESTTFSATLANVTSWSLKKDGSQVASGDAATSINQSITGYGEYKLYLNGSSTAACSQTITKKEEGGGMCTSGAIVKTYTCGVGNTGNFDTAGAVCVKIKGSFGGWGFSNSEGRKWRINGGSFGTTSGESVDATSDGYVYIDITAGSFTWASVYWYNCK